MSITCRNLFNARYYVDDPTTPGEGFQLVASKLTYREGDTTNITDFPDVSLPLSKKVDGIEYTFNGWYTDQALTQQVELPYTIDGNVSFYAKYLSGRQVIYDLAGWKLEQQRCSRACCSRGFDADGESQAYPRRVRVRRLDCFGA